MTCISVSLRQHVSEKAFLHLLSFAGKDVDCNILQTHRFFESRPTAATSMVPEGEASFSVSSVMSIWPRTRSTVYAICINVEVKGSADVA